LSSEVASDGCKASRLSPEDLNVEPNSRTSGPQDELQAASSVHVRMRLSSANAASPSCTQLSPLHNAFPSLIALLYSLIDSGLHLVVTQPWKEKQTLYYLLWISYSFRLYLEETRGLLELHERTSKHAGSRHGLLGIGIFTSAKIPLELNSCIVAGLLPPELLYGAKAVYQELDSIACLLETPASGDDGTIELDYINRLISIARYLKEPTNGGILDSLGLPSASRLIPLSSPPFPTSYHQPYPGPSSYGPRPYLLTPEHDIFAFLNVPNHSFPPGHLYTPTRTPYPFGSPHHAFHICTASDPKQKGRSTPTGDCV